MRTRIVYGPRGTKRFYIDGKEVSAEEYARTVHPWKIADLLASGRAPGGTQTTGWPLESVGLAVSPRQVAEANARNKQHGINTRYKPDGTAVVPDAGDYKRLRKIEGVVDRDGFN